MSTAKSALLPIRRVAGRPGVGGHHRLVETAHEREEVLSGEEAQQEHEQQPAEAQRNAAPSETRSAFESPILEVSAAPARSPTHVTSCQDSFSHVVLREIPGRL